MRQKIYYIGRLSDNDLCIVFDGGGSNCKSPSNALRPVVTLKSEILRGATEEGTIDNPIVLN